MKKLLLISALFLLLAGFVSLADAAISYTVSPTTLTLSNSEDTTFTTTIRITNTGVSSSTDNLTFSNFNYLQSNFEDSQGDRITFTVNPTSLSIATGSTGTFTLTINIANNVKRGTYSGTLNFSIEDSSSTDPPNTGVLSIPTTIRVDPEVCRDGRVSNRNPISSNNEGFLRISEIRDPDDGDEFNPGSILNIRGSVENNGNDDMDVIVEAILYNKDKDKIITRASSEEFEVREDDEEDFNFDLEVPLSDTDLEDGDEYLLFVKVYESGRETRNCNYDDLGLEFERLDRHVVVTQARVAPSQVMCGANANFVVETQNLGNRDDNSVVVRLTQTELGLNFESSSFSLRRFDRTGDSATITHSFTIPNNAQEGVYSVDAAVIYDGGRKVNSKFVELSVRNCGAVRGTAQISLIQETVTATQGKLFGLPFIIKNPTTSTQTYTIEVIPVGGWAETPDSQAVTLQAGQETTLYSYLTPKTNLASGAYTARIEARQAGATIAEQTVTIQIGETGPTGRGVFQPNVTFASIWRNLSNSVAFWIIAIIIVFALVIYVLSILLRPK